MSPQLIARSADLTRLRIEGYDIAVVGAFLQVRSVPYVAPGAGVRLGTLICELTMAGDETAAPATHVMHFLGEMPCSELGAPIERIRHQDQVQELAPGVVVDRSFSSKPIDGGVHRQYHDYHEKVTTYVAIISSPAKVIRPDSDARTFTSSDVDAPPGPHVYQDTASSRSGIAMLANLLSAERLAIVGLGGTGGYILDLVSKTSVSEVHLFDGDVLLSHNAFRSPGAVAIEVLRSRPPKAEYFAEQYSQIHRNVLAHPYFVTEANLGDLDAMTFVFIAIDDGPARRTIVKHLGARGIPFVDVGIGLLRHGDALMGQVRTTLVTEESAGHVDSRIPFQSADPDAEYASNIQVADLNALNAVLAVMRWKRYRGFYLDQEHEHHSVFSVAGNCMTNDEFT